MRTVEATPCGRTGNAREYSAVVHGVYSAPVCDYLIKHLFSYKVAANLQTAVMCMQQCMTVDVATYVGPHPSPFNVPSGPPHPLR